MDFSKSFDNIDHHKLVHTLKHIGVNLYITTWSQDFLFDSSQHFSLSKTRSLRGSMCSLVFHRARWYAKSLLAYIIDLPGSVKSRVRLFADDTIVQVNTHSLELIEKEWSMDFYPDKFSDYTEKWHNYLPIHTSKSQNTQHNYVNVTISRNL